jgi:hypothetical protein
MKVAALALGLLALSAGAGCFRAGEGIVRVQAAAAFSCADYALDVQEVGPEVYRASGCGQELIYACQPIDRRPGHGRARPVDGEDVADTASDPVLVCARRPL